MSVAVAVTIVFNLAVTIVCLCVAGQILHLRRHLARAAETVRAAARSCDRVLKDAPGSIDGGRKGTRSLRQRVAGLGDRIERVRQVWRLLASPLGGLGQFWFPPRRPREGRKIQR